MILEYSARQMAKAEKDAKTPTAINLPFDPEAMCKIQSAFWQDGMSSWQHFLHNGGESVTGGANSPADKDRRFAAKQWPEDPLLALIPNSSRLTSTHIIRLMSPVDSHN